MKKELPTWKRVDGHHDRFALVLLNPGVVAPRHLENLIDQIVALDTRKLPFSDKANKLWRTWLKKMDAPLPSSAYGLLSNWFLTDSRDKNSQRAYATKVFWGALFCAEPRSRLTDSKKNDVIDAGKFDAWWDMQSAWQGFGDIHS